MPKNETVITDEDGDYSDWIELYNHTGSVINLTGYTITDDSCALCKWVFPECILPPEGYLFLFASGKDRIEGPFLHTNFRLDSEGEPLFLCDNQGNVQDSLIFGPVPDDISFGRKPDGSGFFFFFDFPTPGTTNDLSNTLHFSHNRGFYTQPFVLTVSSDNQQDSIYFTIDGSEPQVSSFLYKDSQEISYRYNEPNVFSEIPTNPDTFTVNEFRWAPPAGPVEKATVLRFRSFRNSIPTSQIYTHTYFVDSLIAGRFSWPVISLVADASCFFDFDTGIYVPGVNWNPEDPHWTGNYYKTGDEWERDVHIEYFTPEGETGFYQDAGVRIHGKRVRRRPQKTLRLYARKEYGKEDFNYPLFPQRNQDKYKRFLLSTTLGSQSATIIEDVMVHDMVRSTGMEIMEYRPAVLFLNGEYWGIHTLREYQDENYLSGLYNIHKDSIDLLSNSHDVVYGSNEEYLELAAFIENHNLADPSNFNYVAGKMDIEDFIDYQITEIFFKNVDWPGSNIKFWKPDMPDSRWRWILYDLDSGFGEYFYNMMEHATLEDGPGYPNPPWSTLFLRKLLDNEGFREQFINRFAFLLNTTLQSDSLSERINFFVDLYSPEINRHIERWNYPESKNQWLNSVSFVMTGFVNGRPCVMREHIIDYFGLTEFGFNCDTLAVHEPEISTISLFPNPSDGRISLSFPSVMHGRLHYQVYSTVGKVVDEGSLDVAGAQTTLNLNRLQAGIYHLVVTGAAEKRTARFVVLDH
ncbi:MAG: CotH kinase family protein [Bacteroidales bacterium]|nr:CotH kinase family protein [Bacteroidales bacterium]